MFTEHSRPRRKHTTTQVFWTFAAMCRDAIAGSNPTRSLSGPGFDVRNRNLDRLVAEARGQLRNLAV
jgi:hypothetical protein